MSTPADAAFRPPQQRRSRESLERVMTAGLEVLQEFGFDGFTLAEVGTRARVSIGSIYSRFPSKDALILAIYDRGMEDLVHENEETSSDIAHEDLSSHELAQAVSVETATQMLRNEQFLAVFMRQAPLRDDIRERGMLVSHRIAEYFRGVMMTRIHDILGPDPELRIEVAYRMVYCTFARRITHGPHFESPREIPDDTFVQEVARAAADYLIGCETPEQST